MSEYGMPAVETVTNMPNRMVRTMADASGRISSQWQPMPRLDVAERIFGSTG